MQSWPWMLFSRHELIPGDHCGLMIGGEGGTGTGFFFAARQPDVDMATFLPSSGELWCLSIQQTLVRRTPSFTQAPQRFVKLSVAHPQEGTNPSLWQIRTWVLRVLAVERVLHVIVRHLHLLLSPDAHQLLVVQVSNLLQNTFKRGDQISKERWMHDLSGACGREISWSMLNAGSEG